MEYDIVRECRGCHTAIVVDHGDAASPARPSLVLPERLGGESGGDERKDKKENRTHNPSVAVMEKHTKRRRKVEPCLALRENSSHLAA